LQIFRVGLLGAPVGGSTPLDFQSLTPEKPESLNYRGLFPWCW